MTTPVKAVWLRTAGHQSPHMVTLEVLVEVDGTWVTAITTAVPKFEAEVSHIANLPIERSTDGDAAA